MKYMIAIDAGGTKTEALLLDRTGTVHCRTIRPDCNVLDRGLNNAADLLNTIIGELRSIAGKEEIEAVFGGVAGNCHFGTRPEKLLKEKTGIDRLRISDDTISLISGTLGQRDGCGLVAGTGSSLYARAGGELRRVGGWGYLIDTVGSGYDIGRAAIIEAVRAYDGRGEETLLRGMIEQTVGAPIQEAMPAIYAGGRPYIASLAHLVFEARELGDAAAGKIFTKAAGDLAELVNTAGRYFEGEYSVVCGGGLFSNFPEYMEEIKKAADTRSRLIPARGAPVYGSAVEAARLCGADADEKFRSNFDVSYSNICGKS